MTVFNRDGDAIEVHHHHEVLRLEPWGPDSVRVRAANRALPHSDVGALQERPAGGEATITLESASARLVNGELTAEVDIPATNGKPMPLVRFIRTSTGEELLAEGYTAFKRHGRTCLRAGQGVAPG